MSFLLWQREQGISVGASRIVLRANEVPLFQDALHVCQEIEHLRITEQQRTSAAREQAQAEGIAQGRESGWQAARDELAAALTAAVEQAARERANLRGQVAALALQVARKLMGEFAEDVRLAALASTAAHDLLPAPTLTLVVHPDLCEAVRARLEQANRDAEQPAPHFDVRGDVAVPRDTCRIETEHGSINAALDAQLQRLASAWGLRDRAGLA